MQTAHFAPESGDFALDLTNVAHLHVLSQRHQSVAHDPWYRLDDSHLCSTAGQAVPRQVADLLDVASQITLLDRVCRRPRKIRNALYGVSRGWSRRFSVTLGVREPERWNDPRVKTDLERLLTWLTEDTWNLAFRLQERRKVVTQRQALLQPPAPDAWIVLFSGGLDSLAGAVALLDAYPAQEVVLTSVTHKRLQAVVNGQFAQLQQTFGPERIHFGHLRFEMTHMPRVEEYTQRTRGFRFLACAGAQAVACGAKTIVVCENGVGCLNLPYNFRQLGAQHTRATHPRTLIMMNAVFQSLDLPELRCTAPWQFQTKGELCAAIQASGLGRLIPLTVSCDGFPIREETPASGAELHCGFCTSCLLRRQSLFASGLAQWEPPKLYRYDVCVPHHALNQSKLYPLKMMLDQVGTLEHCHHSTNVQAALLNEFSELTSAVVAIAQDPVAFGLGAQTPVLDHLQALLDRYVSEWQAFPFTLEAA